MYNPFRGLVLERVLANLRAVSEGRHVFLLYHTPVERVIIDATGSFELLEDLGFGVVYRLRDLPRPDSRAAERSGACAP